MHSGLNCTDVIRYLHRLLGASLQEIELSDDEMMRIVFQESLPTYSKFFPYRYKLTITQDDSIGGGYTNVYKIPNKDRLEIIGVSRMWLNNMNSYGGSRFPVVNDPFETQLLMDHMSRTVTPQTFDYEAPDIVTIKPKIYNLKSALIEVKTIHPKHLRTIPMNMRDEFLKLCGLDVLVSLYPIRKRFENMTTVYGSIQLFLDQVDSAAGERTDLLEKWRQEYLKDSQTKKIWIA